MLLAAVSALGVSASTALAAAPVLTSISPASGPVAGGVTVNLTGSGFTGATTAQFGTVLGTSLVVNNDGSATVVSPALAAGTYQLTITTAGGSSGGATFSVGQPAVTGVFPAAGPANTATTVTISGSGFTGATAVTFGSSVVTNPTVNNDGSITVTSPSLPQQTVDVTVTTAAGTSATNANDKFTFGPPYIAQFSPLGGPSAGGTVVTITGTGFAGVTAVLFGNGTAAQASAAATNVSVNSAGTSITATTPSYVPGSALITVITNGGTATTSALSPNPAFIFNVGAGPVINSVDTSSAAVCQTGAITPAAPGTAGCTTIVINGTGFDPILQDDQVFFGGAFATPSAITGPNPLQAANSQNLVVQAPPHQAGAVALTVTVGGITATSPTQITYLNPAAPAVTSVSTNGGGVSSAPNSTVAGVQSLNYGLNAAAGAGAENSTMLPGQLVTVNGSGFTGACFITLTFVNPGALVAGTGALPTSFPVFGIAPGTTTCAGLPTAAYNLIQNFTIVSDSQITFYAPFWAAGLTIWPHVVITTPIGANTPSTSPTAPDVVKYLPAVQQGALTGVGTANWNGGGNPSIVEGVSGVMTAGSVLQVPGLGFDQLAINNPTSNLNGTNGSQFKLTFSPVSGGGLPVTVNSILTAPGQPTVAKTCVSAGCTAHTYTYEIVAGNTLATALVATNDSPPSTASIAVQNDTLPTAGDSNAVTFPQVAGAAAYKVLRSTDGGAFALVSGLVTTVVSGTNLTFTDTGAVAPAAYAPNAGPISMFAAAATGDTFLTMGTPILSAGTYDLQVATINGTSATQCADQMDFEPTPGAGPTASVFSINTTGTLPLDPVTNVVPATSSTGMTITVTGANFGTAGNIFLGTGSVTPYTTYTGLAAPVGGVQTLTFTTPTNRPIGAADILVTPTAGAVNVNVQSRVWCRDVENFQGLPTVTSVTPSSGPAAGTVGSVTGSDFVTIQGQNFLPNGLPGGVGATKVLWIANNGTGTATTQTLATNVIVNSTGTMIIASPPALTQGTPPQAFQVLVQVFGTNSSTGGTFFPYNAMGTLTLGGVPAGGAPPVGGTNLTVTSGTGGYFGPSGSSAVQGVFVGGAACTNVVVTSDTTLNCVTPPIASLSGGGPVQVRVLTSNLAESQVGAATAPNTEFEAAANTTQVNETLYGAIGQGTLDQVAPAAAVTTMALATGTPGIISVTSVTPNAGPQNTAIPSIVVKGTGFTAGVNVYFGGVQSTVVTINNSSPTQSQLTATAPAQSGAVGNVPVVVGQGALHSSTTLAPGVNGFTYETQQPVPTIASISPAGGQTGATIPNVVITGTGFSTSDFQPSQTTPTVFFGSLQATNVVYSSDTMITVTAPAGSAGVSNVTVVTQAGTSNGMPFTYQGLPTVTSITPTSGPGNTSVTVTGTNFLGATKVWFGSAWSAPTNISANTLTANAPGQVVGTAVPVNVTTGSGSSSQSAVTFTYNGLPIIPTPTPSPASSPTPGVTPAPTPTPGTTPAPSPTPTGIACVSTLIQAINDVYNDLLGRNADPSGLAYWNGFLSSGGSEKTFIMAVLTSTEFRTDVVNGDYVYFLGRNADPGGLAGSLNFLGAGGTFEGLESWILGSPEYFNGHGGSNTAFVSSLYNQLLHRAADSGGLNNFVAQLNGGATTQSVAYAIDISQEADADFVQGAYSSYLGRSADPSGLAGNLNALLSGSRDEDVITGIISSGEYYNQACSS
ncbi:MAG: IPT/TIG domain-containing protein [Candidatus Dormibacteria bacterium]